ncbi:hypothetical protein PG993_003440 [Apiospora rasikravindrae]|uniref:4'-phosphopantetheinyl transferase domain-containing protein n=1 Tax=Apiospora rasikravindrae TaxID=990691 RepID=A0ABR1U1V2_9PEZI
MSILGLGNDICHIPRIYRILTSCHAQRFIARVLTAEERSEPRPQALLRCISSRPSSGVDQPDAPWATGASDNRIPNVWKAAVFMAGRFAAKEAAIKAHSSRRLTFEDIRIVRARPAARPLKRVDDEKDQEETGHDDGQNDAALSSGPPVALIKGYPPGQPDTTAMLSISHDGDYAAAVCLSVQET